MGVVFLNRSRRQGAKGVIGPVTLLDYVITPEGTPVSSHDASALLAMTEPPCCGKALPFDGQVRSFDTHVPTAEQVASVPDYLYGVEPVAQARKVKGRKRDYKTYTRSDTGPVEGESSEEEV